MVGISCKLICGRVYRADMLYIGGVVCSDDDLRAIVHEHCVRWSPLMSTASASAATGRHAGGQRSASLDTSSCCTHSQLGVFSSSVESLSLMMGRSPSPVFLAPAVTTVHNNDQPSPSLSSDRHEDSVAQASQQPGSSLPPSNANVQSRRKVGLGISTAVHPALAAPGNNLLSSCNKR